mmetsp:Transcript_68312/g.189022  ORF Transcript_68312/g.189022 Transcript_68312/m.189022 type:complete len:87 (+) Transcript_68312:182-442(+)
MDLFAQLDLNNDKTIDRRELASVLQSLDARYWTETRVQALFSAMDRTQDQRVSYDDFVNWVFDTSRWRRERRKLLSDCGVSLETAT